MRLKRIFLIALISVLSLAICFAAAALGEENQTEETQNTSQNKVYFIKTGQSDSILLESNGKFGLIDTSYPSSENGDENVSVVLKQLEKLNVDKLEFLIATHAHSDHTGGIPEIAEKYVDFNTRYIYKHYI